MKEHTLIHLSGIVMGLCSLLLAGCIALKLLMTMAGAALLPPAAVFLHSHEVLLEASVSPGGSRQVNAYLLPGNATTAYTVAADEVTETGEKRIYWQYRENTAEITWLREDVVCINGVTLDLARGDTWDSEAE